jgi:PKD repeat protein
VNATPLPDFTFSTVCHEQNAVLTNMTSGNGTKITSYSWSFGEPKSNELDTSSLKNPVHLYNAPGTYEIMLKVKNALGCKDSVMKSLTVYGLPDANYSYSVSCAGDKTVFSDLSIGAVAPIVDREWTFYDETGIAGKSDKKNTEFIYNTPGEYLVNLKVTDEFGCVDTINQYVTTWSVPKSLFTYTDNYDNVQGQLQLENNSVDATRFYWNFGDGKDSYAENPVALYQNDGSFDITLVTRNDKNCSDTMNMKYEFLVKGLYIPNAFSPTNMKTEVQLLKPVGINLIEYRFEIFDRWGNLIWWTDKLDAGGCPLEGWDGKYKGILMPEGAYPWRAFGIFKDGSIWESINIGNNENMPQYKVGTATMIN